MQRRGVFLNLDRSPGRRVAMEQALAAAGLQWVQRQAAIDGASLARPPSCRVTPAEYGCYLSHLQAAEQAPEAAFQFVFEDDVELSAQASSLLGDAQLAALQQADVVFLDCQPDCASHVLAPLWRSLERRLVDAPAMLAGRTPRRVTGADLLQAAAVFRWGLQAYAITPKGRARWLEVLREGLQRGPVQPVDLLVGDALRRGALQGLVLVPFLATPRLSSHAASTIGDTTNDTQLLASAIRRLLFAGPIDGLHGFAETLLQRPRAASPDAALLGRLMADLFAIECRHGVLDAGRRG